MSGFNSNRAARRRTLATAGVVAAVIAAMPAQGAVVGVCTGVSLPRSVVTGILAGPLNGIATPVQGRVNGILGALAPITGLLGILPAPLSIDVTGLLDTAASGAPITLQALDVNGVVVGPADNCQATADSYTLDTPQGISIGGNSITGLGTGTAASAGSLGAIALGNGSSTAVAATNSIALGTSASATAANSVALGAGSTATRGAVAGYAAPGLSAPQTSFGEVSVGTPGGERQITNVAAGSAPTDAVNVAQVTGAINAVTAAAAVQYSNAATPTTPNGGVPTNDVTFVGGGAGPVAVHNVAAGTVTAASTDAVNGSQLFTTNQQVTTNTTNIATNTSNIAGNTTAITNLSSGIDGGTIGIVRQVGGAPGAGTITVGAQTAGTTVDFTNSAAATRTLTGVSAGAVTAASTDAVNGSQLFATNQQVTTNTTNIANNTANIAGNTTSITNLNNGTAGLVQQAGAAPGAGQISVGAATGGTSVTIAGTDGNRRLSGLLDGTAGSDAATVAQLAAVTGGALNAVQYDTVGGTRQNSVTLIGGAPGTVTVTNVADGNVAAGSTDAVNGEQLFATNTNVTTNTNNIATNTANIVTNTANISTNTTNISNLTTGINNGTIGLLQQVGGAPGAGLLTVGAATGGTQVSFAGTDGNRVLSNVADGVANSDAATVGQLGAVSGTVANAVLYDTVGGVKQNSITLAGGAAGPVTITNVADGNVAAGSTDAVNGEQLFATNANVTTNTNNIATNTTNISNLTTGINNGTLGLVQQVGGSPGAGLLTVGASTGGTAVSFAGTSGNRILSNVADGVANSDAATVGQLGALGGTVANAVLYDTVGGVKQNSITLVGGAAGPVTIANVADGAVAAGSHDAVNGEQLFATNTQVTQNTTDILSNLALINANTLNIAGNTTAITNLTIGINTGTLGLVQQTGGAPGNGPITVGAATGGTTVSFAGTGGNRTLSNVADGVANSDAATVGQLTAVAAGSANAVQYDTVGGVRQNSVTLSGGAPGPVTVTNVAAGALNAGSTDAVNGAQLYATNQQVASNTTNIANNSTAITNLTTNLNNGSVGLVQQTGGAPGNGQITVGANTGGTSVTIAGTDGTRVLSGLSNGVVGSDAATVAQLAAVTGGALNAVQYDTVGGTRQNSITLVGGSAGPVTITNVANGAVAAGSTDAVNGGQLAGVSAQVAANTTNILTNTTQIATNTSTINQIVGGQAGAFKSNNAAAAPASVASGANASAGGFGASATGARSLALGNGSTSSGTNSVALGAGSTDGGVANVVSVGSVGGERRLTNVRPGLNGTDAVNLSQLQAATNSFQATTNDLQTQINGLGFDLSKAKRRANAGTAGALAAAGVPQAFSEGAGMVGGSVGYWQGQVAFAIGVSKIIGDKTVVKAAGSVSGRGSGGFNAGVGFQF